ncbi:MAG: sigma-70 family RNA polymerase sigma factor [Verrucomicrobiales bacterium]|nr:sigma-70 family RNA polymerase sigma factor [Verrucomicrobiales bacterium]
MAKTMQRKADQITDEWLVLRSQEGSVGALNLLLRRWQPRLASRAYRLTVDADATSDIVQEALIAIANGIRKLDDPVKFRSWSFTIVSNKSRDWIRRRTKERTLPALCATNPASIPETGRDHPRDRIRDALSFLEEVDRELLRLHYYEGLTLIEIGAIENIPEGTVKSRLFTARQHLRHQLNSNP